MVAATVVIAILLSAAALAWVAWPLLNKAPAPILVEDDRLAELLGRKDAVVTAIRDLEFDYGVGKLDASDYQLYDGRLRRQAVALIQQIEQIAPASTEMDGALENEILRRRKLAASPRETQLASDSRPTAILTSGAPIFAAPSAGKGGANGGQSVSGRRFCTSCGHPLEPQHRFCANCGNPVDAPVAATSAPSAALNAPSE